MNIFVHPAIDFKSIKSNALFPDRNLGEVGSDLVVEAVTIHAQVVGRIPQPQQPGDQDRLGYRLAHFFSL
ncbi:MAG: hypothetical protein JAY97_00255 [Candidatus Thiodiazotropha sp. 'RUGA']|nr:hypothetical protein [Candidatus Thiodiazotropha sp. 'RUGA']